MASIDLANINFCPGGGKSSVLEEKTTEMLLSETTKEILPSAGYDGLSKVTVTHAPVEERTEETITVNGSHVITPSEGFDATQMVVVDVNVPSPTGEERTVTFTTNGTYDVTPSADDKLMSKVSATVNVDPSDFDTYSYKIPLGDDEGLKALGWDDVTIKRFKYNNLGYAYQVDDFKVTPENIALASEIKTAADIVAHKDDPNFVFAVNIGDEDVSYINNTVTKYILDAKSSMLGGSYSSDPLPFALSNIIGIYNINVPYLTSGMYAFYNCSKLKFICNMNVKLSNTEYMFSGCSSLTSIPQLDTSTVTNMGNMFYRCSSLTAIPQLDTSNVTNMGNMLYNCTSLTSIPQLDTSNVTNMGHMFFYCDSLTTIPQLDTSNVTNMGNMFYHCSSLTAIPQLDTSNVTNMEYMLINCSSLTAIPQLDTSNVTNTEYMFSGCSSLTSIPQLDTSNVTNMGNMFSYCDSLTTIPQLDTSNVTNTINMFRLCKSLTTLGGFTGLKVFLDLSHCTALTHDSLMNVINKAADVTANPTRLTLGRTNLAKLTDEEKAIATNKGWVLA